MRTEVSYFNDRSRAYRAEYDAQTPEGYSFRVRREKVLAMVPPRSRVLDIASGPGIMIPGLQGKGCDVVCVDAAPEMIERIKEEYANLPGVSAVVGDAYKLPCKDGEFDAALAMGLIEYLDDEPRFLAEALRVLHSGGIFIITFPNYWSPWRVLNRLGVSLKSLFSKNGSKLEQITHREYTKKRALRLLEQNGFSPEQVRYYNFRMIPYPLDRIFPRLTILQSKLFEHLDRTPLSFLGTGFIVEARRR